LFFAKIEQIVFDLEELEKNIFQYLVWFVTDTSQKA